CANTTPEVLSRPLCLPLSVIEPSETPTVEGPTLCLKRRLGTSCRKSSINRASGCDLFHCLRRFSDSRDRKEIAGPRRADGQLPYRHGLPVVSGHPYGSTLSLARGRPNVEC